MQIVEVGRAAQVFPENQRRPALGEHFRSSRLRVSRSYQAWPDGLVQILDWTPVALTTTTARRLVAKELKPVRESPTIEDGHAQSYTMRS